MTSETKKVRLTLNESVLAFYARVKEFEQAQAATEARIHEIVSRYHLTYLPKENDDAYALPIDRKIRNIQGRTTIPLKLIDGRQTIFTLSELDHRIESFDKILSKKEEGHDESKKKTETGIAAFAGRRLSSPWTRKPNAPDEPSIEKGEKDKTSVIEERARFQKAREELAAEVDATIEALTAKAAIDLTSLKVDLSGRSNLLTSLLHATTICDALRAEQAEIPPQIHTLDWDVHPEQMSSQDLHKCYVTLHNMLWHEHDRNLREHQAERR